MAKPRRAEHIILDMKPMPEQIEICRRCRRGIVVYKGRGVSLLRTGDCPYPVCGTCSEDEPGEPYVRIAVGPS